ncbi:MAG TPA: ABC transporter ATP-binding protein [Dongiaceae bacterium]|jgi:ABC-type dipeptide/oligopeptide/nickel transport system ATPase component|nr:ABC transporter ATP-binding protein [Dongiaceae bacterium]
MTVNTPPADAPLLSARDVKVHLRVHGRVVKAVDGVDLEVHPGQCVGIVGESGSGKSTLGRAMTRLLPNVEIAELSGSVRFCGEDVLAMTPERIRALRRHRGLSMVFQDPLSYLNPTLRIDRQLGEALRHLPDRAVVREQSAELLRQVGLDDTHRILRLYPHELSGGMRQRVLIAMALAPDPQILVADEPTTALDATVQYQVIQTLRRLNKERNLAMLVITHDLGMVAELCDWVYVMNSGKVVEAADVFALFDSPQNAYTASLLAAARRLHQTKALGEGPAT